LNHDWQAKTEVTRGKNLLQNRFVSYESHMKFHGIETESVRKKPVSNPVRLWHCFPRMSLGLQEVTRSGHLAERKSGQFHAAVRRIQQIFHLFCLLSEIRELLSELRSVKSEGKVMG
jgi:hypothetical protein